MKFFTKYRWYFITFLFIAYMLYSSAPRYLGRASARRIERDQGIALSAMKRIMKTFCRHPEKISEEKIKRLLAGDLQAYQVTPSGEHLVVSSFYVYRFNPAERRAGAHPKHYVPHLNVGSKDIFAQTATLSFYGDCNFSFFSGDVHGRMPEGPQGLSYSME